MSAQDKHVVLPPVSALRTNLTCHYCIVGCGYHVYRWPEGVEGGRAPNENALGIDFRRQLPPMSTTLTSAMSTTLADSVGRKFHVAIVPDKSCVVNQGLSSTRGGQIAKATYSADGMAKDRLSSPKLFTGAQWVDTTWEEALVLYAGLTRKILDNDGPDQIAFNCFDHGGGGGGFENTWATGKLMFSAIQTPMVRIHNRPAYNSECHATREMGIGELNNSYEDAELSDTIFAIGTNSYETQTNYFLAHWVPNLSGATVQRKQQRFANETVGPGRLIVVDPRRTPTVAIAEKVAGKENVLHLDIQPGTDVVLFNALFSYVVEQGWNDSEFIEAHTTGFQDAVIANRTTLDDASRITGVSVEKLKMAAEWAYKPKASGHRPRTMHAYEKGVIWGNDNYLIQSSIVDVVLATRNVGRRGTGVVRMGGHQEGYCRPPYPGKKRVFVDQEIIAGKGLMYTAWGANPFQTTLNAEEHRLTITRRAQIVRSAMSNARGLSASKMVDVVYDAVKNQGGLFVTSINIYPTLLSEAAHLMLPAAMPGEMNLTSMNGERRLRLSEKFTEPPGSALPDCLIASKIANAICDGYVRANNHGMASRFAGFDWTSEEDAFNDGFRRAGLSGAEVIESQGGNTGYLATYARLRAAGNNGVQLPIRKFENDRLIGTEILYEDGKFDTHDGRALFKPSVWKGLPAPVAELKERYRFWINSGRVNEAWQTMFHDQFNSFVTDRLPMPMIEINTGDAKELDVLAGDVVEVYNDHGSTYAMAYITGDVKHNQTFMQFAHFKGVEGNVTTSWTDRNLLPYYKGVWANLRRVGTLQEFAKTISFKSRRVSV